MAAVTSGDRLAPRLAPRACHAGGGSPATPKTSRAADGEEVGGVEGQRVETKKGDQQDSRCHPTECTGRRGGQGQRLRYRKHAARLLMEVEANPEAFDLDAQALAPALREMLPESIASNELLMGKLIRRVQKRAVLRSARPDPPLWRLEHLSL